MSDPSYRVTEGSLGLPVGSVITRDRHGVAWSSRRVPFLTPRSPSSSRRGGSLNAFLDAVVVLLRPVSNEPRLFARFGF